MGRTQGDAMIMHMTRHLRDRHYDKQAIKRRAKAHNKRTLNDFFLRNMFLS